MGKNYSPTHHKRIQLSIFSAVAVRSFEWSTRASLGDAIRRYRAGIQSESCHAVAANYGRTDNRQPYLHSFATVCTEFRLVEMFQFQHPSKTFPCRCYAEPDDNVNDDINKANCEHLQTEKKQHRKRKRKEKPATAVPSSLRGASPETK